MDSSAVSSSRTQPRKSSAIIWGHGQFVVIVLDLQPQAGGVGEAAFIQNTEKGLSLRNVERDRTILRHHPPVEVSIGVSRALQLIAHQSPPLVVGFRIIEINGDVETARCRITLHLSDIGEEIKNARKNLPLFLVESKL